MTPIKFKGCNTVFAENQPEYNPLPVFYDRHGKNGLVISCWKLTLKERIIMLFIGKLYVGTYTFHRRLQPMILDMNPIDIISTNT